MATRKDIKQINRRIDFLMSSNFYSNYTDWNKLHTEACVAVIVSGVCWRDCLTAPFHPNDYLKQGHIRSNIQIMILAMEIRLSPEDVSRRSFRITKERREDNNSGSPQKETRDNKGVYIGNGGGYRNTIRYPKLNKSKKIWAMFYKMFPWAAKRDNWNGEKSDRFPRKNKKKNR